MRFTELITAICLSIIGLVGGLKAQEAEFSNIQVLGIQAEGEGVSDEMRERLAETATSFSFASPGSSFSFGSSAGVDPNSGSQLFNLLANDSVRRELGLSDEQYGGVRNIMQEAQKRLSQLVRAKMSDASGDGPTRLRLGGGDFREIIEENQAVAEEAIEEILLPEQLMRIRQLAYQVQVSHEGMGEALVNGRLGQEIGVHDDQKQHLTDRAAKITQEAQAAIRKIKAAAQAELLSELAPEQKQAAEALLGDYFDYEELSLSQQIRRSVKALNSSPEEDSKRK